MRPAAAVFVSLSAGLGLLTFTVAVQHLSLADPLRFVCYLLIALLASTLKVRLPGMESTMSVHFLFVLLGVFELSLGEAVLIGCAATLLQCVWKAKHKPEFVKVFFNIFGMAAPAIFLTYKAYHSWGSHTLKTVPVLLMAAALTYFVANTLPVSIVIALSTGTPFRKIWSETFFWSLPYYLIGAALVGAVSVIDRYIGWQSALLATPLIYWVYRSYQLYLHRLEEEKKRVEIEARQVEAEKRHVEEVCALHLRTIEGLALAIEAKDHNTHSHLHRVRTYAVEIGIHLGLGKDELDALRAAALLHDIGKLAIPDHIINKPNHLTLEEVQKVKTHPVVGAEILERVSFPYPVAPIVRSHHERWDGAGYPDGLQGVDIPIGARILTVVDCLDGLISDQQHRQGMPLHEAVENIYAESGKAFDPAVVEVIRHRWSELESLAKRQLGTESQLPLRHRSDEEAAGTASETVVEPFARTEPANFLASIASARQEAHTLFELSQDLGNSFSQEETLSQVALRLHKLISYNSLAIWTKSGEALLPEFVTGEHARSLAAVQLHLGTGLCGRVAEKREPMLNGDPALDPELGTDASLQKLRSVLAVPLEGGAGLMGVMALYSESTEAFSGEDLRILQVVTTRVANFIEKARRYREAETSATVDYLTDLANSRALSLHMGQEIARCTLEESVIAVMVCDLDGFKEVNDCHGHLTGDRVLKRFAHLLRQTCRETDYLARTGGDEFVVVARDLTTHSVEACAQAYGLLAQQAGMEVCGIATLSLSAGVSFFPEDGQTAEELFSTADKRMYSVKAAHHDARARSIAGAVMSGAAIPG